MTAEELINIIAKKHSRTSCSDDNISNGFYHKSPEEWETNYKVIINKYSPDCTRCALLAIANGRSIDTDQVINGTTIYLTNIW